MRPGNTGAATRFDDFFEETMEILQDKKIGLIRCDSGFYNNNIFKILEGKNLNYVIAARQQKPIRTEALAIKNWVTVERGLQVGSMEYKAVNWEKSRKIIAVRQSIKERPTAQGKLFEEYEGHRYSLFVTNLDLPPHQIWKLYRGKANAENRIKELKCDFGMDSFTSKNFWATEAAFRTIMVAYNLMALFKQLVCKLPVNHQLRTMRFKCFALGGWLEASGANKTLHLAADPTKRVWLLGLLQNVLTLEKPYRFSNA